MQLKSILNRVQLHRGFVYGAVRWSKAREGWPLRWALRPKKRCLPIFSSCGRHRPGYDTLKLRYFEFVPFWGIALFFLYAMRRVECPECGIKVERVPWVEGKNHLTTTYTLFMVRWARQLSWKEVGVVIQTFRDNVFRAVQMTAAQGLAHRDLENVESIGIDEISWNKGHQYLTMVYHIDAGCKRLLWIGKELTSKTWRRFFKKFGEQRTAKLRFVCSDMWKPYLRYRCRGCRPGGTDYRPFPCHDNSFRQGH